MNLKGDKLTKCLGAETLKRSLRIIAEETLSHHLFFDEGLLSNEEFWKEIEAIPCPKKMEGAFQDRDYGVFRDCIDKYSESILDWYNGNYKRLLSK